MTRQANHGGSIVDVVTQEYDTMVVERSHIGRVPGKDGRRVTNVDVVGVPLDGEAHSHSLAVRQIREVGTNLVRVLSRSSDEPVLEGGPIGCVLNPMSGLREEVRDQRSVDDGGHGQE
jgi:hypothetical protein